MKKAIFTLAVFVMAFGTMSFAQGKSHLKSSATKTVLKHYGVRDETTLVPQIAEFDVMGMHCRDVYTYDEYDYSLKEELTSVDYFGVWTDFGLVTYEYDFSGNLLEKLIQTVSNDGWENYQFSSYSYEDGLLSEVIIQNWEDGDWVNETKEVYNYNGNVSTVLYWNWNGSNWSSNELYTYTYSETNIELLMQYMQGGAWQNSEKQTFTLNFDEHVTEVLVEEWQGTEWVKKEWSVYEFAGGVYNTKKVMVWNEGNWVDDTLFEFEYEDGNAVHGTCKTMDGTLSDGDIEMAYGYSAANKTIFASEVFMTYVDLTSVNENVQVANFKVYPVPAENELTIQAEDFQKAEIYSLTGQKLMESETNTVGLTGLASGAYLLKVYDTAGNAQTQKMLVK